MSQTFYWQHTNLVSHLVLQTVLCAFGQSQHEQALFPSFPLAGHLPKKVCAQACRDNTLCEYWKTPDVTRFSKTKSLQNRFAAAGFCCRRRYVHVSNYGVNKHQAGFVPNTDAIVVTYVSATYGRHHHIPAPMTALQVGHLLCWQAAMRAHVQLQCQQASARLCGQYWCRT